MNDSIDLWFGAGETASAKSRTATGGDWRRRQAESDSLVLVFACEPRTDGKCIFQFRRRVTEKLFNGINWYKCSLKASHRKKNGQIEVLPKNGKRALWSEQDLFEECTQKKLISSEQHWRLVGGTLEIGNRIKAWKSSWLFQTKFMIHCFARNCTKKKENEEELGMLEEIKIIRGDPGVRSLR